MSENKEYYPGISYQELFNFMFDNHNLLLSNSQMDDLITVIHRYYTHPLALSQERADFIREVNNRDINGLSSSNEWDSERVIGCVKERFKELEEKKWDWRSFYNGWLEGRSDMLAQIKGWGKYKK